MLITCLDICVVGSCMKIKCSPSILQLRNCHVQLLCFCNMTSWLLRKHTRHFRVKWHVIYTIEMKALHFAIRPQMAINKMCIKFHLSHWTVSITRAGSYLLHFNHFTESSSSLLKFEMQQHLSIHLSLSDFRKSWSKINRIAW